MPRRKQQQPKHLEDPEEVATSLQNGFGSGSGSETEGDEHVCGKCRAEFPTLSDFLLHKKSCVSKRPVLVAPDDSDPSAATAPLDSSMDTDDDEDDDLYDEAPHLDLAEMHDWIMEHRPRLRSLLMGPNTNVTLAELENTSVAVAQLGQNGSSPLNQLVSSFRQNQVEQINLLKVIARLMVKDPSPPPLIGAAAFTPPTSNRHATNNLSSATVSESAPGIAAAYPQGGRTQDSPMMTLPPQEDSLALLQKHTERYIQDSMARKSFLNGMADDNRSKKGKDSDPAARHKCGFCGKHLGSDSALQIHLRSHTGEKPFQCDVCGSAFSTRGNLKVHQQRHKERMELLPPNFNSCDEQRKAQLADGRPAAAAVGDGNPPSLFVNGGDDRDISKVEQALDFSKTVNGRKSPQGDINSRSISPNDTSNFTDNSMDGTSDENINEENYSNLKIDVERFDDDDGDNSECLDDDGSEMASSHPSFSTSPNFAPYFLPNPYDNFPSTSQVTPGSSTLTSSNANNNNTPANIEGSDNILHDPTYYQDLLPRIGSNDNSWESLIEVTKTSETSKLQQLVDNIENKLIEPNQCIICHRVLSCKSALQMHYRTHTGERPYRCKLCNRAFTTKGNLKTHMGVHRTKSSSRLMHQCPVCHRQYPNSMILQQHIRSHTSDHVMQLPPLYSHRDDRPSTLLPPSYPRQFLMPTSHVGNSEPLALTKTPESQKLQSTSTSESVIKPTRVDNNLSQISSVSPALSNRSSCSPSSNIDEVPSDKEQKSTVLNFAQSDSDTPLKSEAGSPREIPLNHGTSPSPEKDEISVNGMDEDMKVDEESSPKQDVTHSSPMPSPNLETEARSPIDVAGKISPKYLTPNNALMVTLASDRPLPMTLPSDMPIPFSVHGADRHYPPMSIPSCTPNSYTASLTALENHVKGINSNVTHPLPFPPHFGLSLNMSSYFRDYNFHPKPPTSSPTTSKNGSDVSADDRSTPGGPTASIKGDSPRSSNNNNHHKHDSSANGGGPLDLTPRSSPAFQRPPPDLSIFQPLAGLPFAPQHHRHSTTCRVCFKTFACNSALEIHYRSHTKERPFRCEVCDRGFSTKGNMRQHMLTHKIRDFPPQAFSASSNSSPSPNASSSLKVESGGEKSPTKTKSSPDEAVKRPSPDTSLPGPPKRTPGQPKHMCQVCHKPFSSGSALQIHMRTHTGDKPFQCHICHRAFTTKGNLKVHMGTHMWSNSTSRRGRRMSLDISPLQLTPTGKPGDFGQAPYFPYLSPFMNGLPPPPPQPPPKMNEISVIQTAGMGNGIGCTAPPTITTSSIASTSQQPLALLAPSSVSKQTDREEPGNFSNQNQNPLHSQGKDIHAPSSSQEMAWPWKISCNVCNKICSSSTELELHLRNSHRKNDSQESDRTD